MFKTNFLVRIKSMAEGPNFTTRVAKDVIWAMQRCTSKPLPNNVVSMFAGIISELIHLKNEEILKE